MSDIRITWIVPIHDLVLLAVFEDRTKGIYDVKLLPNTDDSLMPSQNPNLQESAIPYQTYIQIQKQITAAEYVENSDGVEVTIELDDTLYEDLIQWCRERCITPQKLMMALFRFCADKDNTEIVQRWFSEWKEKYTL